VVLLEPQGSPGARTSHEFRYRVGLEVAAKRLDEPCATREPSAMLFAAVAVADIDKGRIKDTVDEITAQGRAGPRIPVT
jgi:hypothetical protein